MREINWDQIGTVLFDLDGTLIDLRLDAEFWKEIVPRRYAETMAISTEQSHTKLKQLYRDIEHSMQWYDIDHWADTLQLPIREMQLQHMPKLNVRSGAYPLLQKLNEMGKRLLLLTDSHPYSLEVKMAQCDLAPHFEALISSHQFQKPKMNAALWTALLHDYAIDPQRTLLLDDLEAVLDQAANHQIAFTVGIENPDSTLPPKTFLRHCSIADFSQLFIE